MDAAIEQELQLLQQDYLADVREIVAVLRHHAPTLTMRSSFKAAFPVLLYLSHQLKGSGGSIGYPRISELASELNGELNRFLDVGAARPSPNDLSAAVLRIAEDLETEVARDAGRQ